LRERRQPEPLVKPGNETPQPAGRPQSARAWPASPEQAIVKDPTDAAAQASYLKLSLDDGNLEQASAAAGSPP
jgi:hypothetical protein